MHDLNGIRPRTTVVSADGHRLGVVDKVQGNVVVLGEHGAGHRPLTVPLAWISSENGVVRIGRSSAALRQLWA